MRYVLKICRLEGSARIPCTTGKLNLPSVRSSAKPLLSSYWYVSCNAQAGSD